MNDLKHYYFAENDQQLGPFTIEELKTKRLKKSTLVWTDGMLDWDKADNVDELKEILIPNPPPLPKRESTLPPIIKTVQINQSKQSSISKLDFNSKYDLSYTREIGAIFVGFFLLLLSVAVFLLSGNSELQTPEILGIISIIIRIFVTIWVVKIASRQNRDSVAWGLFAFLSPSIALIVIGFLKKLRLKIELKDYLPIDEQVSILLEKANNFFIKDRYLECIEFLNKAIEIENNNFDCIKLRGLTYYELKNYEKAKLDFEILIKNEKFLSDIYSFLGNITMINNKDRKLAVSYWIKANELGNEDVERELESFHTFTGNYVLDEIQIKKKVHSNLLEATSMDYLRGFKYQGGLSQIDQIENINSFENIIILYNNGIDVELLRDSIIFHIGIAFYEIDNIVYEDTGDKFELHLSDGNILTFTNCDLEENGFHNLNMFNKLCHNFERITGKKQE